MFLESSTRPLVYEDFAMIMEHFVNDLTIIERESLLKEVKMISKTPRLSYPVSHFTSENASFNYA
jgi:hypothetical protein